MGKIEKRVPRIIERTDDIRINRGAQMHGFRPTYVLQLLGTQPRARTIARKWSTEFIKASRRCQTGRLKCAIIEGFTWLI
jgi:hypothetical protein